MLALDLIDRRTMWRDYWIEWVLAAVLLAIDEWLQWRIAALDRTRDVPLRRMAPPLVISICVFPLSAWLVVADRRVEAGAMKHVRFTNAHQSITFSRRMMLLGGAQAAVGTMLIGRMGWLAIAQNEKYQLLIARATGSSSSRYRRAAGWIIDRNGKPIAINKASFRVDIIPQQMVKGPRRRRRVAKLLDLPPDEVERINRELASSRGFQPVSVADNIPYEQYAAITVRLPELPGVAASRGFTRFYPGGLGGRPARRLCRRSVRSRI